MKPNTPCHVQANYPHNPGTGRISLQFTLTGKGETKVTIQLVNENGQWMVDGLTVP